MAQHLASSPIFRYETHRTKKKGVTMSLSNYDDLCRDCFRDIRPLRLTHIFGLVNSQAEEIYLCEKCLASREKDFALGRQPRPLGIFDPLNSKWIDLEPVVLFSPITKEIVTILVKLRVPIVKNLRRIDGGNIRIKLPQRSHWDAVPGIDCQLLPESALKSKAEIAVRRFLENSFSSNLKFKPRWRSMYTLNNHQISN